MNSEQMKILAGDAIAEWLRHHGTPCTLDIANGLVIARKVTDADRLHRRSLIIPRFALKAGLTSSGWDTVGTALHNLYYKEKACQAHQKH